LHPGYVFSPGAGDLGTYQSVANWCRKLPVVDAGPCPDDEPEDDDDSWDVAARVAPAGGTVTITGHNFGDTGGEVRIGPTVLG
ncbi:hypothetical protein, partial [Salmonella sp. SAL4435]|uniref:hypothetical protein n=1 Tax=Salmonella sp. SAL4435 TaxID=3159890 RepID=UPI00397DC6CE